MIESLTLPKSSPFTRNHFIRDGINQAIYKAMKDDASIYLFGEGAWVKQKYDAPKILAEFPERIVTLPIGEDGNTNFAVGASLLGVKPVVNVISGDFLYRTMDSIVNNAAKLNFTGGDHTIVIQAEFLLGGPTTGQRNEAIFAHVPGLRVAMPSTPRDAYGLMLTALSTPGVTLFFEDRMIRDDDKWEPSDLRFQGALPFGASDWRVKGQRGNVTILTYGVMRQVVERALKPYTFKGDYYADDYPMLCDVIDLCSLYPLDWGFIKKMLERTGKLLIVEPDITYGGIGAEIAATIAEQMPDVRVKRLGAKRMTVPASASLHNEILPTEEDVLASIEALNGS